MFGARGADHEGERARIVTESTAGLATGGGTASVASKKSPKDGKERKLLKLEDEFGVTICGCLLTGNDGLLKFCAENVKTDGSGDCSCKSHSAAAKAKNIPFPAWFIVKIQRHYSASPVVLERRRSSSVVTALSEVPCK